MQIRFQIATRTRPLRNIDPEFDEKINLLSPYFFPEIFLLSWHDFIECETWFLMGSHFKALTECSCYSWKEFYLFQYFSFYYASGVFLFFITPFFSRINFWREGNIYFWLSFLLFYFILFYFHFCFVLYVYIFVYVILFCIWVGFFIWNIFKSIYYHFISICDIKNIDIHVLISICPYVTYRCKV